MSSAYVINYETWTPEENGVGYPKYDTLLEAELGIEQELKDYIKRERENNWTIPQLGKYIITLCNCQTRIQKLKQQSI